MDKSTRVFTKVKERTLRLEETLQVSRLALWRHSMDELIRKIANGETVYIPPMTGEECKKFAHALLDESERLGVETVESQRLLDVLERILRIQGVL